MGTRVATTLAFAVTGILAGMPANAGCIPRGSGHCIDTGSAVDLNSVSDIASKIVSEEPSGKKQDQPVRTEVAAPTPYTGPIVGAAPGKRAPTVGYSWSLQ
jgi:hypothetical protein